MTTRWGIGLAMLIAVCTRAIGAMPEPAFEPGDARRPIRPELIGLFTMEDEKGPVACALCVHDNDLAGLFDIGVRPDSQGRGYGRSIVRAALRWAKHQGAKSGWLQVEKSNLSANELYARLGFETIYSYTYRIKKD